MPRTIVLVSPQYLADGGMNKINDVIGPLVHLFAWPYEHNPRTGRIDIDSPCGSVFLDFAPTARTACGGPSPTTSRTGRSIAAGRRRARPSHL
ncbi:hypothetical protein [Streptomyces sp. DSM 118878]